MRAAELAAASSLIIEILRFPASRFYLQIEFNFSKLFQAYSLTNTFANLVSRRQVPVWEAL
jgi:hypothetical protein